MVFFKRIFFIFIIVSSDFQSTLNNEELNIIDSCMSSKHPCVPTSLDCSNSLYSAGYNLQETILDLLTLFDPNYTPSESPIKQFPGVMTGILRLRASSSSSSATHPEYARFEFTRSGCCISWVPFSTSQSEYLLFGTPIPYTFNKIQLRARDSTTWVKTFKLKYSLDGVNWVNYNNDEVLIGNGDSTGTAETELIPFVARVVKLNPITWNTNIGMKAEIYVSNYTLNQVLSPGQMIAGLTCGFNIEVSSVRSETYDHNRAIIGYGQDQNYGWSSLSSDAAPWVIISSVVKMNWKILGFQADQTCWLTSITLQYTVDGANWIDYNNGNIISLSLSSWSLFNITLVPFDAISVKINIKSWNTLCCSRFEVYCTEIST